MNLSITDITSQKKPFLWVGIVTGLILLIPFFAMQFTDEVTWNMVDYIVMGLLLFSFGCFFILVSSKVHRKYRLAIGTLLVIVFLYIWAELAVGIFTTLGS